MRRFVANVVLKFYESVARMFADLVKQEFDQKMLHRKGMARLIRFLDYSSYGGAPLLAVRGVPIVGHGCFSARAIQNAIRAAEKAVENHLTRDIGEELAFGATG